MTPTEYQELASRTASTESMKDPVRAMNNWALGLVGEAGEVIAEIRHSRPFTPPDKGALHKELGDCCWYVAMVFKTIDLPLPGLSSTEEVAGPDDSELDRATDFIVVASSLADHVKKVVFHGHELSATKVQEKALLCYTDIQAIAAINGFDMADVFSANIDKLKKRFPDGFSSEASINRTE